MENSPDQVVVVDQDGVRGMLDAQALDQAQTHVIITYDGNRHVQAPVTMLHQQPDGIYHLSLRLSTLDANAKLRDHGGTTIIPIIQEEAHIDKHMVESGRVRVTKQVRTHEENIDTPLLQERVQVERMPIDQIVAAAPKARYEGETLVIPVLEEVLVVEKRLLLKEEIRITKYTEETLHEETITLRREEVAVEHTGGPS